MNATTQKIRFGQLPDGSPVDLYTLTNAKGSFARITNFGTIITELHVPDRDGKLGDVVLGFDNLEQYVKGHPCFGATVGRVANRIAKGKFTLDGRAYSLAVNNGPNHLHGGIKGFDKVLWRGESQAGAAVNFYYSCKDGEEGYPGNLEVKLAYELTDSNELRVEFTATSDKPTPVNLSNHSYFNFRGSGNVLEHELQLHADHYTVFDDTSIPTGEIRTVKGTPLDFTTPRSIGARFTELKVNPVGYDNNYVLNGGGRSMAPAARVYEPVSGRVMEVHTTQPGLQFYTGNFLNGSLKGKSGVVYNQHSGFCLETQHYPDSVNHPDFPSVILRPGQTYRQVTVFKFSAQ